MKRAVLSVVLSLLTVSLGILTVSLWNGIYDRARACDELQRAIERRRVEIELLEMELRAIEHRREPVPGGASAIGAEF